MLVRCFFLFKQQTAYVMRISDWSSDVCSSDLSQFGQVVLNEMVAAMGSRECRDIQRGDHSTGSASNRNRERTEARLELGLNKAPALFADRTDFIAQGGRIDDRPVRPAFEPPLLQPRLPPQGVRSPQHNPP